MTSLYKKQSKQWVLSFIAINIILISMFPLINPYRLMPFKVTIPGLNDIKPELYDRQRDIKVFDIAYIKPKTILLGSSRVLWGLDPKNPNLQEYQPVYNAGILGPPIYEVDEYFKHALINQPKLKRVILALDFYSFNSKFDGRDMNNGIFGKNWHEILKARRDMIFDFHALADTVFSSLFRRDVKSLRSDGRLIPDPTTDRELYKDFFSAPKLPAPDTKPKNINAKELAVIKAKSMKDSLYQPFGLSKEGVKALSDIINTCKQKHIDLIIYLPSTYHNTEVEAFHDMKIWNEYKSYLQLVAKMHPFWDFTGWNEISMNRDNYIDGSHHTFAIGNLVIDRIFNRDHSSAPKGFGVLVDSKSVDSHLKAIDNEYYRRKNA